MLQNLLADRFRLVLKREFREMSVYAADCCESRKDEVVVAGRDTTDPGWFPRVRRNADAAGGSGAMLQILRHSGEAQMTGHALSISDLAKELRSHAGRIVVDKTGLNEVFDVDLKFARDTPSSLPLPGPIPTAPPPPQSIPPLPGPTLPGPLPLRTALEEQLGLKLESAKMPIEVLIIESVEKPSEN